MGILRKAKLDRVLTHPDISRQTTGEVPGTLTAVSEAVCGALRFARDIQAYQGFVIAALRAELDKRGGDSAHIIAAAETEWDARLAQHNIREAAPLEHQTDLPPQI